MVGKWTNEPCSGVDEVVNTFWVLTVREASNTDQGLVSRFNKGLVVTMVNNTWPQALA